MAYTRLYPMAVGSYLPSANPLLKQANTVIVTDGSGVITGVSAALVALVTVPADWYCTISNGLNGAICKTYRISGTAATSLTLDNMDGTAWTAPVGSTASNYSIELFKNTAPSENDAIPSAFCCTTAGNLEVITADGQYYLIPSGSMVVGAIYSITVARIVALGGTAGHLLAERGYSVNIR